MARNQWETTGPPEIRGDGNYSYFRPYPPPTADKPIGNLDREPGLDRDERYLVAEIMTRMSRTTASARSYLAPSSRSLPLERLALTIAIRRPLSSEFFNSIGRILPLLISAALCARRIWNRAPPSDPL